MNRASFSEVEISFAERKYFQSGLSGRELEVLKHLEQGKTTSQIAGALYLSENTIKTHVRHILKKLGACNRAEAVSKAAKIGLI